MFFDEALSHLYGRKKRKSQPMFLSLNTLGPLGKHREARAIRCVRAALIRRFVGRTFMTIVSGGI